MKAGRVAWHGNTLWRGKRMPLTVVRTRAARFSADLATCIASPCSGLTVVVGLCVGLGKSVCEGLVVLLPESALSFAVEVQEIAEVLGEIPDSVNCELDPEVRGVRVCDGNLQNQFTAAVELAQECFAVEQPRVGQVLWRS